MQKINLNTLNTYKGDYMYLESPEGKWKSVSVAMKCDQCSNEYRGIISTTERQFRELGVHQCKSCSSRRAGLKTAAKMSEIYSRLYSGDGNFAKKPGVSEKISEAKKGTPLTEEHKAKLRKPKSKTEKIKEAANRQEEVERRRVRMTTYMSDPANKAKCREWATAYMNDPSVKERYSVARSELMISGKFWSKLNAGWVETSKTPKPIYCRSGLEKEFLHLAEHIDKIATIESAESLCIKYEFNNSTHRYLPDFKLTMNDGSVFIIETKNSYLQKFVQSQVKAKVLEEFCRQNQMFCHTLNEKEITQWLDSLKE